MDKRRTRRFQLELPVSITRAGADGVAAPGLTKNISSSGVLLTTGAEADLGVPIEYTIALNHAGPYPVNLRCIGKVLRSSRVPANADRTRNYEIAVTLERYEFVRDRKYSVVH
jgi:hypothetical protein